MGNICCCFQKSDFCNDDEHQRILEHPVGINSDGNPDVNYGSAGINTNSYQNLHQLNGANNKQQNENQQNQLYQNVLDRLTSRVIDISSIEKSCEQADLTDREQAYKDKMMSIRRHVTLPSNANVTITANEYLQKNKDPLPMEDYKLITELAIKINACIEEDFKINCDEPFVVGFDA